MRFLCIIFSTNVTAYLTNFHFVDTLDTLSSMRSRVIYARYMISFCMHIVFSSSAFI